MVLSSYVVDRDSWPLAYQHTSIDKTRGRRAWLGVQAKKDHHFELDHLKATHDHEMMALNERWPSWRKLRRGLNQIRRNWMLKNRNSQIGPMPEEEDEIPKEAPNHNLR